MILQNERAVLRGNFLINTKRQRNFAAGDLIKVIRPKGVKPNFNLLRDQVYEVAYCIHGAVKLVGVDNIPVSYTHLDVYKRQARYKLNYLIFYLSLKPPILWLPEVKELT